MDQTSRLWIGSGLIVAEVLLPMKKIEDGIKLISSSFFISDKILSKWW